MGSFETLRLAHSSTVDRVVEELRRLAPGRQYANMQEVWAELSGGHVETHRF